MGLSFDPRFGGEPMAAFRSKTAVTALMLTVLMTASVGWASSVTGPSHGSSAPGPSTAAGAASTTLAPRSAPARAPAPAAPAGTNVGANMATAALAATRAAGLKPSTVFVPRPSASPAEVASTAATGVVQPLYTGSPAPMGLAYYGLSAGPHGSVVGSILNTTSVMASVHLNATGVRAADLFQSSPDSYGIQLNAVATNITLFGQGGYSFWTQNVAEFYPDAGVMYLITNVWNFSGGNLSLNAFYQHGPDGQQVGTEYYFAETSLTLAYPFNVTFYLNSTVSGGRNLIGFNVVVTVPGVPGASPFPYDYVVFNSIGHGGSPITHPSNFTANGLRYSPVKLTDDFELIFGGPGGGSQATLSAADATLGLGYYDRAAHGGLGGYVSVPSAYSYGGETGETVAGANVAWSNVAAGSPGSGLSTYGTMTTGPSVLTGLWNASAPVGSFPVRLSVSPSNAFTLVAPAGGFNANFTVSELAVAPTESTNSLSLIPGNYTVVTELADYLPVYSLIDVTGPSTLTVSLASDPALGIYTPLWAFSNAQIAALASSGAGTAASPYVIENNQLGVIGSEFGLYNDYAFPVYPAVFFHGTTATVEFLHPPSFATATNTFALPGPDLPATNDLQYWFWDVQNVSVVGAANVSGWFGESTFYPVVFDTFNMIFYEGGHNLVASNTFDTQGGALLMFSGGTFSRPVNVGGGNNTVWNNTFREVDTPSSHLGLLGYVLGLGLELAESGDLVYDNAFLTPTTAWLLPINLYTGTAEFFDDAFNITKAPATAVRYAAGFPFVPLTGSILHTRYQGGNYWWDYGLAVNPYTGANNPYGVLPYEETATTLIADVLGPGYYHASYLYPGGDAVPLTTAGTLYPVIVHEAGLASGLVWSLAVANGLGGELDQARTVASSVSFVLPNGTYDFGGEAPSGWTFAGPGSTFVVSAGPVSIDLAFSIAKGYRTLTFHEKDLTAGTGWTVSLNASTPSDWGFNATESSTGKTIVFAVQAGAYTYTVHNTVGFRSATSSGGVNVAKGNAKVTVKFSALTYTVTFTETGLSAGAKWAVKIGHRTIRTTGASLTFTLANGTYSFVVKAPRGTSAVPPSGAFAVAGPGQTETISFT